MSRRVVFLLFLCSLFIANCSYSCLHAHRRGMDPIDPRQPTADLAKAIDSITPADADSAVAPMSRIKLFFKDTSSMIRLVPQTFCNLMTEFNESIPCEANCYKGAFTLVPKRALYPDITYRARIINLGKGDTLLQGTVELTFRTRR